jgi:hypothetical protein
MGMGGAGSARRIPLVWSLVSLLALVAAFSHRSGDPWLFGLYSLQYFLFLVVFAGALLFLVAVLYQFGRRGLQLLLVILAGVLLFALSAELVGQIYAYFRPSYDVLAWQPDRVVGWKQVPHLSWRWGGHYWYARDFSVEVTTNGLGFRDIERSIPKPEGVRRIALLGDSLVEAVQVPFDSTAGHFLEQALNRRAPETPRPSRYEVLNFGISNFGVGQCLLCWEEYAHRFEPDLVFILVADFNLLRTVTREEESAFSPRGQQHLKIRPTFRLTEGSLIREPASDFDEFVRFQREIIRTGFSGGRVLRRRSSLFLGDRILESLRSLSGFLMSLQRRWHPSVVSPIQSVPQMDADTLALNLRILEELGRQIREAGARFVVVDVARYFNPQSTPLSTALEKLCTTQGFGYTSLSDPLIQANRDGIPTHWNHDGHFNEGGNRILAQAMYQ